MPLTKLQFSPGINQEVTSYSNEGGWRDCDKIRFRFGYPEKLGGWEKFSSSTYLGSARALHNWIALDGSNYLGVGTHLKYYIEEGGAFNDITPIRLTTSAGDVVNYTSNSGEFGSGVYSQRRATVTTHDVDFTNNGSVTITTTSGSTGGAQSYTAGQTRKVKDDQSTSNYTLGYDAVLGNTNVPASGTINMDVFNAPGTATP